MVGRVRRKRFERNFPSCLPHGPSEKKRDPASEQRPFFRVERTFWKAETAVSRPAGIFFPHFRRAHWLVFPPNRSD